MNLRHAVSLLPTPRASANENRQMRRSPSQAAGRHGKSLAAEIGELLPTPAAATWPSNQSLSPGAAVRPSLHQVSELIGDSTPQPSKGGRRSSAVRPPGQLTIWDA
ncbi:hypothetical protein [Streptomyces chattanoogensis]|uniref:hypothetical protein n=1 Tax=Streptomyces chattanoogensis TaxID=66876 RepID=UPI0036AFC79C